jgi:hypothetical protein
MQRFQDNDGGYIAVVHVHHEASQQRRWTVAYIKECAPEMAELSGEPVRVGVACSGAVGAPRT